MTSNEERKPLLIRPTKSMWTFLKKKSIQEERSVNAIVCECLEKFKQNYNRKVDIK